MKDVRLFFFHLVQVQTVKAGTKQIMRISLEKRKCLRIELANLGQVVGVADLREALVLLLSRQAGKVVNFLNVNASEIATNRTGERRFVQELRPRGRSHAEHEPIFAESLPIEKTSGVQLRIQLLIVRFVKTLGVDAQIGDQRLRHFAIS